MKPKNQTKTGSLNKIKRKEKVPMVGPRGSLTVPHRGKKVKIGTILDEKVFKKLKERSAREGRTISQLLEEAVKKSEQIEPLEREIRIHAMERFLANRFKISKEDWDAIMEEDYYDQ